MYKRGFLARLRLATRVRARRKTYGDDDGSHAPVVHAGKRRGRTPPVRAEDLGWPGMVMIVIGLLLHSSIAMATYEKVPPQFFVLWLMAAQVAFAGAAVRARAPWPVRIKGALYNLIYFPFGLAYLLA